MDTSNDNYQDSGGHTLGESQVGDTEKMRKDKPTMPDEADCKYLFCERIDFLGIRFIPNERKGFDESVQKTMSQLLKEANLSTSTSSPKNSTTSATNEESTPATTTSLDLPNILFKIPTQASNEIELVFDEKTNKTLLEQLFKRAIATNNEEELNPGQDSDANNKQNFEETLDSLKSSSIRIPKQRLFFYRGQLNSSTERCIALTTTLNTNDQQGEGTSAQTITQRYQQCIILYAESPAKISEILVHFRHLYGLDRANNIGGISTANLSLPLGPVTQSPPSSIGTKMNEFKVVLMTDLEILEELSDGKRQACPREKDSFKLRTNLDKIICINLYQDLSHFNYPVIQVERCFGMLLSPGRNLNPNDMVPIGLKPMTVSNISYSLASSTQWQLTGLWKPDELNFDVLNTETPRDTRVFFSIAIDLIIANVEEPVRFILETKAKIVTNIVSLTEKFWNLTSTKASKQHQEQFTLIVRQLSGEKLGYEVMSCLSSAQIAHRQQRLSMQLRGNGSPLEQKSNLAPVDQSANNATTPGGDDSDDDEPLQSGMGVVSKECSEATLLLWADVLDRWKQDLSKRPKQLSALVRKGIPEALRPEVWQLLSSSHLVEFKWMEIYRNSVTKPSKYEAIIQRDICRTFPLHEKFRDPGSSGQESLFRICKAYSNYDTEIGYCQGMSFLVAVLLLHMPEEQAFCCLLQIMNEYGLRNLYKDALDELHCLFWQLERLLDDQSPELFAHFLDLNVETHMFASSWFLTLFTTKFPLNAVFLIIDLFLLEGMQTVLKISLALLDRSKKDLLARDFEGIMKYFRITLPKMYRSDQTSRELIRKAVKINVKKAPHYKKDYERMREEALLRTNPVEYLQRENKRLMATTMRLEQELDEIASEVLAACNSKVKLMHDLDKAEDKADTLNAELLTTRKQLVDAEEEKIRLEEEVSRVKELCRAEVERAEGEICSNRKIIDEYKRICRNHQMKADRVAERGERQLEMVKEAVKDCAQCAAAVSQVIENSREVDGAEEGGGAASGETSSGSVKQKINDLEMELIKTKMALAEAEDKNTRMAGELHMTRSEVRVLQEALNNKTNQKWFSKTYAILKEGANKVKQQQSITSGGGGEQTLVSSGESSAPPPQPQSAVAGRRASASVGVSETTTTTVTGQVEARLPKSISRDGDFLR